jgi:carboxyl-terminal processing protease
MNRLVPALLASALLVTAAIPSASVATSLTGVESDELETSFSLLTSEFYKKVDQQVVLDGARAGMLAYLEKAGVKNAKVAEVRATDDPTQNAKELENDVRATVKEYGAKFGSRDLTYSAIAGLLGSVKDKYTVCLSPKEYQALNEDLDGGGFSGVGIQIQVDDKTKYLSVMMVIVDGPADKAGLKDGDTILAIDGKSTKGLSSEQDAKLLRGDKGTVVKLTIQRDGAELSPIAVTRDTIHQPSVISKLYDNGIGYARLTVFGSTTASELSAALAKLQSEGAKAYILDLRDNGGGYLNAAIDVSSKFIPSGPIVSVEARGGSNTQYDAEDDAINPKPLAVLVNQYTASASEITSGAIQDNGVGELIGEKTYGKGVVQTIHPLPDGSAVKITSARYLTPRGRDINLIGIQPDIITVEPKTAKFGDPATDPQLQSAMTYLQGRIAQLNS